MVLVTDDCYGYWLLDMCAVFKLRLLDSITWYLLLVSCYGYWLLPAQLPVQLLISVL